MKKKVVCVNYLNTKPLIRGLTQAPFDQKFELIPENPRVCSEKFIDGTADIALVPVATLGSEIENYVIISDYCIASDGAVDTVGIFSNTELKDIKKLYLDDHSKTSQQLTRIIFEKYLNLKPSYEITDVSIVELDSEEGALMIGDKAFAAKGKFKYYYDLGELWTKFTDLPFVYAVWIARESDEELEHEFNEGVKLGLSQLQSVIEENGAAHPSIDLDSYYHHNIKYHLNKDRRAGLKLFLDTVHANHIPSLS